MSRHLLSQSRYNFAAWCSLLVALSVITLAGVPQLNANCSQDKISITNCLKLQPALSDGERQLPQPHRLKSVLSLRAADYNGTDPQNGIANRIQYKINRVLEVKNHLQPGRAEIVAGK